MPRFDRDWAALSQEDRARFRLAVRHFVADLPTRSFRPGLRVKRVQGTANVDEMTWAPDGRATFQFGASVQHGPHVIWRRVGRHPILREP
ncbi:hypothetical protein BH24CHL9_BH24CHL9_02120 [soil metagenome]